MHKVLQIIRNNPKEFPLKMYRFIKKRVYIYNLSNKYKINISKDKSKLKNDFVHLTDIREHDIDESELKEYIQDANNILEGRIKFLYMKDYTIDMKNINFCKDYKSGYVWEKKIYNKLNISIDDNQTDIKNVWEVNRLQFFIRLAQAYIGTKDKKYLDAYLRLLIEWQRQNPVGYGPNWLNAMEAAIRLSNICVSYGLLKESLNNENNQRIENMINQHLQYIINNLEWTPNNNGNHYISNLCGLIFGAIYSQDLKNIKYIKFAVDELSKELNDQTLDDGSNFEKSIFYHKLVLEMILYTYILLEKNNIDGIGEIEKIIGKMTCFTDGYIKKNGEAPQYGDNDSGVFIPLSPYWYNNLSSHRHLILLTKVAKIKNYTKFSSIKIDKKDIVSIKWIEKTSNIQLEDSELVSRVYNFPEFGAYIYKSKDLYLACFYGENGQRKIGGHSHNDKLSLYLMINDKEILIDPGTGSYTKSIIERNYFKSASNHSTLSIPEWEKKLLTNNSFELKKFSDPIQLSQRESDNLYTSSFAQNFLDGNAAVIHQRDIKIDEKLREIEIIDCIDRTGDSSNQVDLKLNFIFSDSFKVEVQNKKRQNYLFDNGVEILFDKNWKEVIKEKVLISPYYSKVISSNKVYYPIRKCEERVFIKTLIKY